MVKRPTQVPKMRGVEALLSQNTKQNNAQQTLSIEIGKIQLSNSQPRKYFDPEKLENLVESIREFGILEPLLVRPLSGEKYELIAGERRLRAASYLDLAEIPVVIKDVDEQQAIHIALIENLQREDLNPVEETEGILQLLSIVLNLSEDDICSILHQAYNAKQRDLELNGNVTIQLETIEKTLSEVGRFNAESFRSNRLPLLNLPSDILSKLRRGDIQYTKARVIARIKDPKIRAEILEEAIAENLSLKVIREKIQELSTKASTRSQRQAEKFSNRLSQVSKQLKDAEVWKDTARRKQAEKLLAELEALAKM